MAKAIRAQLDYYFRYQNVDFDQTVTVQTIYYQLSQIVGLDYVSITRLSLAFDDADYRDASCMNTSRSTRSRSSGLTRMDRGRGHPLLTLTMSGGIA